METSNSKRIMPIRIFTNSGPQSVLAPLGEIIHTGFGKSGIGVVYLRIESEFPYAHAWRIFHTFGDGDDIPEKLRHVGTAHDQSFTKTWHVYEE